MKVWHVILILVLLILSFLGGRYTKKCEPCYVRDTVVRYDTIISEIPDPQIEVVIDTIEIPYVIYLRDTVSGEDSLLYVDIISTVTGISMSETVVYI